MSANSVNNKWYYPLPPYPGCLSFCKADVLNSNVLPLFIFVGTLHRRNGVRGNADYWVGIGGIERSVISIEQGSES
jgi:hypothetical protein